MVRLDAEHRSKGIRLPLERCFFVRVRNFRRFSFWANSTPEKSHLVLNSGAFGFADYTTYCGGRGLIKVPPHFFAVRPVRRLQRLVVLRADAGAEGIDIGSHWLPGFDGLGEM